MSYSCSWVENDGDSNRLHQTTENEDNVKWVEIERKLEAYIAMNHVWYWNFPSRPKLVR